MEAHLQNWLSLLLRWGHFITGVAWIGASFYFNWLENRLQRENADDQTAGDLWAVHGGGFYYLKKFAVAPEQLPDHLHWFKWEAYATWLSGFALLWVVYYWNAGIYLLDPAVSGISSWQAITVGVGSLLLSWLLYDGLCRSKLSARGALLSLVLLAWFVLLAWGLGQFLSGRAAFIHVGAAIGTIMVANVYRVIIPSQRDLVDAVSAQRAPDAQKSARASQRSRHNNYFTLPVLFIMISSHYPSTYGHSWSWVVLLAISVAGVLVRHYFNVRHLPGFRLWPLAVAALLLAGLVVSTAPGPLDRPAQDSPVKRVPITEAWAVVQRRCMTCHSRVPANVAFTSAPQGIELDSEDGLRRYAERVYLATVVNQTMPPGNLTGMTGEERILIANWFEGSNHGHRTEQEDG